MRLPLVGTVQERLPLATRGFKCLDSKRAEKNLLGFRARASRIRSLASGRGGLRYCGGQQSGLKNLLLAPRRRLALGAVFPVPPAVYQAAICMYKVFGVCGNNTAVAPWLLTEPQP
jgi:hypothetical protein